MPAEFRDMMAQKVKFAQQRNAAESDSESDSESDDEWIKWKRNDLLRDDLFPLWMLKYSYTLVLIFI